jgi:hypothetical protein
VEKNMTDDEFYAFLETARAELEQKQAALTREYGFGSFSRFWHDQEQERLRFFDAADNLALEVSVIYLGSYVEQAHTWQWAWANKSMLPHVRQQAAPIRALHELTGVEIFDEEDVIEIDDEAMAWELAAMAIKHLGALGGYRAPSSRNAGLKTFMAITGVEFFKDQAA